MALALVSAVILSPLYTTRNHDTRYDIRWNSGFVLPMVLAGLIIAIKTTSSPSSSSMAGMRSILSPDPSSVYRVGGSSWGLAGVLIMLMLVLSWQDAVHHFLWK
ncbi:C2 domain-containing protein 3 [Bienertia sinuspersici]